VANEEFFNRLGRYRNQKAHDTGGSGTEVSEPVDTLKNADDDFGTGYGTVV
jgi:hypothetical protein